MSKIIKNGIVYGETLLPAAGNIAYDNTASGLNATTMQNAITELKEMYDLPKGYAWAGTQAQWDALTPVEKAVYNGKIIAIIDDDEAIAAEDVTYDNTSSGLTAANVQAAVDELNVNDVGKKEYVDNDGIASEIFNVYSGQFKNVASGAGSHAEGVLTVASNDASHAEGLNTVASGQHSHAEGMLTEAAGFASHASGYYTIANTGTSTVVGRFNVADGTGTNDPKHLFIVGNGTTTEARSNILEVSDSYMNLNGTLKINNTAIGSLAMKSSATDSYTPAGTVSTPTISATTTPVTVNSITAVGTLPTLTYDAVNKEYIFSPGTLPTKGNNVTVIASIDSLTSTQPTFTGTAATIEVS